MKTKNSYLTGCLALLIALSSCTKMNDTQEKYLDWGEKIYAAKIDSVFALSGYQRQVIDIYYSAPRIDHGIIVYNLNQDTVVFELPEDGSRYFSVPINNLEEAEYNYTIYTFDKDGNKSLPTETSGKVYGRFYGDYLVRKAIDKIDTLDGFSIYTKGATEAQGINVTYTDLNGDEQVRYFPVTGPAIITDAEPGSEFTYTTVYRPDATAVDSVESLPAKGQFPNVAEAGIFQAGMKVYDSPSNTKDEYGWVPGNACDRNHDSGYHTGQDGTWPQQLAFELNYPFQLTGFRLYQRMDSPGPYQSANPKKFRLLGTNETPAADGSDNGWTVIGEYEIIKPSGIGSEITEEDKNIAKNGHEFKINGTNIYRYLRIQVTETWSGAHYIHFMELEPFGFPQE
ncbi:MAG: DUF4998 domain-containing protein [Odoribacter splanchnicus]|mgnify:FL=1